ncbi:cytochrome c oxidase subunit IVB [Chryseomicrobium palamuruense]|uniref:Cytochrome c oxidase subunit IVB n=1 Tax=Chryseomicrobium palamuruense TaxID=682973 RepID=A0ABV8URS7_9BACL
MGHDTQVVAQNKTQFEYARRKRSKAMQMQVVTFAIMIFLTFVAFAAVASGMSAFYVGPVLLLLAAVQVVLQLYYFMHMSDKGHNVAAFFLYSGALFGFTFVITFLTIVWW